jgi:hypothetical protein
VFLHLPGLTTLGIDVKADVSVLLTTLLGSLAVLASLHAAYGLAAALHLVEPVLHNPSAGLRQILSIVLLNATTMAIACRC